MQVPVMAENGTPKRLALVPARGGSKRIPRKNITDFLGRPMLSYPLEAARESGLFDLVHVSTDDTEIAAIARACGADTSLDRPAALADDHTPLLPVAKWVLESFSAQGLHFDDIFILFPCSPLLEAHQLREAYDVYLAHGRRKNLLTVAKCPAHLEYYYRRAENGALDPVVPGGAFIRSQELGSVYYETGTFTIFSREWLLGSDSLADDRNYVSYEIPALQAVDIDSPADLEQAKLLYRLMHPAAS